MRRALGLAADHRYFLRAAARLYVHNDECDRAHSLLQDHPRTKSDPWLLAAEISIAQLAERNSHNVGRARRILGDAGWDPANLTELSSALATLELSAGHERQARKLFRESLRAPNDNALAQAEWASERLTGVGGRLHEAHQRVARPFEALSLAAAASGESDGAVRESWHWLMDQPFSAQPARFGSYHAGQMRDFERSLSFAERGLQANPSAVMLRNNAAFALAQLGQVEKARQQLELARERELDAEELAVLRATRGLIAFRSGDPQEGERCYLEAIEQANDPTTRVLARLMFVSEMLRLHLPGASDEAQKAKSEGARKLRPQDQGWLDYLSPATVMGRR